MTVNGIIANSVTYTGSLISLDSLTVNSGATLSTDAVNITGVTTTNNGTVSVTNLESVPTMDLTKITGGTTNADWSGNGTFTGNLGTSNLLVSSGIMTITTGVISNANSIVVDGTIVADASKVTTETISGAGTLTVNNLDSSLNADFANLTVNTINVDWSGTATYNGNLTNVDALTISSGTMSVDDSILGTINVNGSGNLTVNANDSSVDLSNVSNTLGTVTINDSASNVNIVGSAGNDVLNLNGGDDTVNLGAGNDTVNVDINNLNANDTLNDTSGTDTLNITSSGTISSDVLVNQVSGFETLNMSNGDDTVTFDDTTDFNNFISEFTDIVDAGGNDTLSFGSVGVSGDLDFTKLGEFENLNLSSANDNITLSGDESTNVNGGAGNDTFSLDFSNVSNFVIDGGTNSAGDDKINITGNSATISSDTNIFGAGAFDNIEALDLTAANLNVGADATDGGVNAEFTLTGSLINEWTNNGLSSGSLKLTLDADAASKLEFTNSGGTKYGGDDTGTSSITNGTYTLDNGAELIISGL
uniref:beta strand repeat-containing protein n=1 Tax=Aliarcobacter sp. TaxID=2321116 RepID=UPI004047E0AA